MRVRQRDYKNHISLICRGRGDTLPNRALICVLYAAARFLRVNNIKERDKGNFFFLCDVQTLSYRHLKEGCSIFFA